MVIDSHEHIMFPVKMQLDKMDAAGVIRRYYSARHRTRRKQAH